MLLSFAIIVLCRERTVAVADSELIARLLNTDSLASATILSQNETQVHDDAGQIEDKIDCRHLHNPRSMSVVSITTQITDDRIRKHEAAPQSQRCVISIGVLCMNFGCSGMNCHYPCS